jgi:hypothetical protein
MAVVGLSARLFLSTHDDGVPRVLLLARVHHGTIEGGEDVDADGKATTMHNAFMRIAYAPPDKHITLVEL